MFTFAFHLYPKISEGEANYITTAPKHFYSCIKKSIFTESSYLLSPSKPSTAAEKHKFRYRCCVSSSAGHSQSAAGLIKRHLFSFVPAGPTFWGRGQTPENAGSRDIQMLLSQKSSQPVCLTLLICPPKAHFTEAERGSRKRARVKEW